MVREIDEEESRIRRLKRRLDDVVSEVRQEGVPNPIRQWQDEAVWSDSWSTSVSQVSQVTSGLIAWYKMSAGSGTTLEDFADSYADSTKQNGSINGATWTTDNKTTTYALDFDGTDDYVTVADTANFEVTSGQSIAMWIKPAASGSFQELFDYLDEGGTNEGTRIIINNDDTIGYAPPGGAQFDSSSTISTGTWFHIVGTDDGSTAKLYIDAAEDNSASTGSFSWGGISHDVQIARRIKDGSAGLYYNGVVDDVRYYNRALSASEVSTIYNNTV